MAEDNQAEAGTELTPETEPSTPGTLFLTFLLLVIVGSIWVMVYRLLLTR